MCAVLSGNFAFGNGTVGGGGKEVVGAMVGNWVHTLTSVMFKGWIIGQEPVDGEWAGLLATAAKKFVTRKYQNPKMKAFKTQEKKSKKIEKEDDPRKQGNDPRKRS